MRKKITVAIDERMFTRLERLAQESGETVEALLERATIEAVQKSEKEITPKSSKGVR